MDFKRASELVKNAKTICLATHIRPDGDAIGSIGAMYHCLKDMGKQVYMLLPEFGQRFGFMPSINDSVKEIALDSYDLLICLDSANRNRINISDEDFAKAKQVLVIDHHMETKVDANEFLIDNEAPANCEIVYCFLKYLNAPITAPVANYIYLGLLTDTGSFNYPRTTSETYKIAAEMLLCGADFANICKRMNDTYTENKMKLIGQVIQNTESYVGGKLRIASISRDYVKELNATEDDLDGMVNYVRAVEGTIVAIYMRPISDVEYKVSIRTETPVDANELAKRFNGGGHVRAAGFETTDIEKTKKEIIQIVERLLESEDNRNT